jgi:hypothetical protein
MPAVLASEARQSSLAIQVSHETVVLLQFVAARWFVCKPKILILVKFGGPWNGKCYNIL